jgi:alpha-beta hydrolase superfamily lysophospholipase
VRWLRFPAADGGTAWARLESPPGPVRGTLIALHGICMETEFWPPAPDYTGAALACGWQVLRPEAPWHGRRRRPGTYGGEPLIAGGPKAFLDFFALAIPELAVWTAWARRERPGMPVAWSGVSLGALTAQKAADAARAWPAGLRPDGLLLVATAGQLAQAILDGRLGRLLGLRPRLRAAGWTEDDFARWAPLLDPAAPCPLPAERVRLLLGSADDLLPFAQGVALARRWDLPAGQVTVRRQGHFSVSLGLLAEPAPLVELLDRLG